MTVPRSPGSSPTWPRAGGLRNGTTYQRSPWAPLTAATDSSCLLPTPTASVYGSSQNGINGVGGEHERPSAGTPSLFQRAARGMMYPTPTANDAKASGVAGNWTPESGRNSGTTLTDAVVRNIYPTPTAAISYGGGRRVPRTSTEGGNLIEAVRGYPTPVARDCKGQTQRVNRDAPPDALPDLFGTIGGMRLNPRFVEWMMGLPMDWTAIGPSESTPSATPASLPPSRQLGLFSGGG